MALDLQYDLSNFTPADASPVEANFARTEDYINRELINRNGTVAMLGQLKLVGNPTQALDAVPKSYVDTFLPIGMILMFGGAAAPPGGTWALCNGAELETTAYPDLYAVIGSAYTPTPGAGRFNLPNLTGRFPLMTSATDVIGTTGGSRDAAVVDHVHPIDHTHAAMTSSGHSANHNHVGADHLHGISFQSGGESAQHYHLLPPGQGNFLSVAPGAGLGHTTSGAPNDLQQSAGTTWNNTDHSHAINGATQAADRGLTTSGANVDHSHGIPASPYTGASANPTGSVPLAGTRMPPYQVVNYVIRVM